MNRHVKRGAALCLALLLAVAPLAALAEYGQPHDHGRRGWAYPPFYVLPGGYAYPNAWFPGVWFPQVFPPYWQPKSAPQAEPSNRKSIGNITWSTKYLYQVFVNERGIDFRVFGDGGKLAFLEAFGRTEQGELYLQMTVRGTYGILKPVFTTKALNFLTGLGVAEVRVISGAGETVYTVDQLAGMATD